MIDEALESVLLALFVATLLLGVPVVADVLSAVSRLAVVLVTGLEVLADLCVSLAKLIIVMVVAYLFWLAGKIKNI